MIINLLSRQVSDASVANMSELGAVSVALELFGLDFDRWPTVVIHSEWSSKIHTYSVSTGVICTVTWAVSQFVILLLNVQLSDKYFLDIIFVPPGNLPPKERVSLWESRRVFFLTPQVMQNDLSRGTCPAHLVCCVVFDEAHKALGNHAYCQVGGALNIAGMSFSAVHVQTMYIHVLCTVISLRGQHVVLLVS